MALFRDRSNAVPSGTTGRPTWPVVHAERAALAAELTGLTDEQWATPSLCEGLTVRQVLTTVGVLVLPTQFALAHAASAFHEDGTLNEDGHRAAVAAVVAEVIAVTARLNVE